MGTLRKKGMFLSGIQDDMYVYIVAESSDQALIIASNIEELTYVSERDDDSVVTGDIYFKLGDIMYKPLNGE